MQMGMPVQQMSKQFPEDGKALINSHIGPSKGCQEGRVAQSVIHGLWQSESSLGPGLAFPSGGHPQHEQQRGEHIEAASQEPRLLHGCLLAHPVRFEKHYPALAARGPSYILR
eukprot:scaffold13749_cov19-Tisochrysis_lutea.AAC.1